MVDLMKAVTWQGKRDVRVEEVPDPRIELPTDAIVQITSSAICGSDLHLYEVLGPYMKPGDILGHEPMGVVQEVGAEVTGIAVGDRVVIPFNISCGRCFMCSRGLQSQCETTQVREQNKGAALFGFSAMYGSVPGGQAEYLRVPQAQYGPIKVSPDGPDERYLFLSDILPTAWQAVVYADPPEGGTLAVFGLGPVGQFAARIGKHWGRRVIGVDGLTVLHAAIDAVRRGGTVSVVGVYGGAVDPMPMMDMFDKQIQLRMGQCNVRRWTDVLLPLVQDSADPLGVQDLVTHTVPIAEAPGMYKTFQEKTDGCIKVVIKP
jgi:threonine dehydrogenase-like Zn-dependent dehydrogenase